MNSPYQHSFDSPVPVGHVPVKHKAQTALPWLSGFTHRWHTNAQFAKTGDRVDGHSARMAVLAIQLFPETGGQLLRAIITHDLGEYSVGDIKYPVKRRNPEFKAMLEGMENQAVSDMGMGAWALTDREHEILKLVDSLDAYLWALHHDPVRVLDHVSWQGHRAALLEQASDLDRFSEVHEIMLGVQYGDE